MTRDAVVDLAITALSIELRPCSSPKYNSPRCNFEMNAQQLKTLKDHFFCFFFFFLSSNPSFSNV